jgi:uncharacterized protein with NRDE domain
MIVIDGNSEIAESENDPPRECLIMRGCSIIEVPKPIHEHRDGFCSSHPKIELQEWDDKDHICPKCVTELADSFFEDEYLTKNFLHAIKEKVTEQSLKELADYLQQSTQEVTEIFVSEDWGETIPKAIFQLMAQEALCRNQSMENILVGIRQKKSLSHLFIKPSI